ncbi:MAG: hypothetical protein EA424_29065 [Planctomycetaceae bacterium]|nr:MAG: hypothetical protein EA424_29065 [Planctomycetaceae bacterium]
MRGRFWFMAVPWMKERQKCNWQTFRGQPRNVRSCGKWDWLRADTTKTLEKSLIANTRSLLDRAGPKGQIVLEGGVRPGAEHNVFELDFGRGGVQICYDVEYPEGWQRLAEKGAELVLFSTQSPQLTRPARTPRHTNTGSCRPRSATTLRSSNPERGSSPPRSPSPIRRWPTRSTSAISSCPGRRD